jgi:hypothetical protein
MTEANVFQRVETSYDLSRMCRSRIISVGCGGARSFLEEMARCGVGEFVLIDPDTVQAPNIGTQQVYLTDIGRPKVDCISERLKQINPAVLVATYQQPIEEIDDSHFAFMTSPLLFDRGLLHPSEHNPAPEITLLCGMTDNFYAQARTHRLSLHFGLPSLCCQLYRFGQAGEVTFTYPGVTPACQRCMLSPRYTAYLEKGYKNDVTSDGAPIFATTRINALCGMIALAIMHHGTSHPKWGDVLSRIDNHTLVQIRMHPDTPLQIFDKVFSGGDTDRIFFDEAVWLPQEPDPDCPDCQGTGNLLDAKGSISDTRIMVPEKDA